MGLVSTTEDDLRGRPAVVATGISARYGAATVLQDINLELPGGQVTCLIGASGCGKTTLLHVIAGLVPYSSGTLWVAGKAVEGPGPDRVMVFQDDAVFPWLTVRENAEYGLRVKGVTKVVRKQRVAEVLRLVRLSGKDGLFPKQLSGGMRKRVDLARALAVEPQVLLMDEPYGALDAITKEHLQLEFLNITARSTMTVLFVTHDLEEAIFLGDRVVVMSANPGRIHSLINVPFSHPREASLKRSAEFQALRGKLAELIG
jgi:NitT/TauT family transport system ATP-binding protein